MTAYFPQTQPHSHSLQTHLDVRHNLTHHQQEGGDEAHPEEGAEEEEDSRSLRPEPTLQQVKERQDAESGWENDDNGDDDGNTHNGNNDSDDNEDSDDGDGNTDDNSDNDGNNVEVTMMMEIMIILTGITVMVWGSHTTSSLLSATLTEQQTQPSLLYAQASSKSLSINTKQKYNTGLDCLHLTKANHTLTYP